MHCSNEVKPQFLAPLLRPEYTAHHGRYVSATLGRTSIKVSAQTASKKMARVAFMAGTNAHPFRRPTVRIPEQFNLADNGNRHPSTARCRD
jgi:hypothetical protein